MRLKALLLFSSFNLAACSTAAPQDTSPSTSSATAPSTDSSESNGQETSTGGPVSTTEQATTGQATTGQTSTDTSPTSTGFPGTTGEPDTSTTGSGTSTGTSDDTTGTGTGTETDTDADTDTTTGGMSGGPCEVDADCKLHDDCCSCYGIPVDQDDGICKAMCDMTLCEQIGIDQAVCKFGQCTTEKVDCSSEVACDSLPPDCPAGTLPGIAGACWSGACVPVESCDKVPDCKLCPDTLMCVADTAFVTERTCLPIPADCKGEPSCACADEACEPPFGVCNEGRDPTDLVCICPTC